MTDDVQTGSGRGRRRAEGGEGSDEELDDERYRNVDPKMIEVIKNEILDDSASVEWADIAGANTHRSAPKLA